MSNQKPVRALSVEKKPESTSLRIAVDEDLIELAKIEKEIHVYPWSLEQFKEEVARADTQIFVLTDDETDSKVYGYLVYSRLPKERSMEIRLLNMGVPLELRGLGIGAKIFKQWISLILREGVKKITLEVRKGNDAAVQFFQNNRFSIVRVHKNYFRGVEDAYVMDLDLTAPIPENPGEETF